MGRHEARTRTEGSRGREPLAEVIDRRPRPRRRSWRDLPRPSRPALLGVAVLVAVGAGAVHLSTAGTALPDAARAGTTVATSAPAEAVAEEAPEADVTATSAAPTADPHAAPAAASSAGTVVVHVTGAVNAPGVVELPAGSRVDDAVTAAGGARDDADLAAVNLARPATDGEQIHVPVPGEEAPTAAPADPSTPGAPDADGAAQGAEAPGAGLVDLNTADAAALDALPGVGPAIAQRIIDHREANGPFARVDDLEQVPGIGPATLEKIRAHATV